MTDESGAASHLAESEQQTVAEVPGPQPPHSGPSRQDLERRLLRASARVEAELAEFERSRAQRAAGLKGGGSSTVPIVEAKIVEQPDQKVAVVGPPPTGSQEPEEEQEGVCAAGPAVDSAVVAAQTAAANAAPTPGGFDNNNAVEVAWEFPGAAGQPLGIVPPGSAPESRARPSCCAAPSCCFLGGQLESGLRKGSEIRFPPAPKVSDAELIAQRNAVAWEMEFWENEKVRSETPFVVVLPHQDESAREQPPSATEGAAPALMPRIGSKGDDPLSDAADEAGSLLRKVLGKLAEETPELFGMDGDDAAGGQEGGGEAGREDQAALNGAESRGGVEAPSSNSAARSSELSNGGGVFGWWLCRAVPSQEPRQRSSNNQGNASPDVTQAELNAVAQAIAWQDQFEQSKAVREAAPSSVHPHVQLAVEAKQNIPTKRQNWHHSSPPQEVVDRREKLELLRAELEQAKKDLQQHQEASLRSQTFLPPPPAVD